MSDPEGLYVVAANVANDKIFRQGAKVVILCGHGDCVSYRLRGISKGGRAVTKYSMGKRLSNFRAQWALLTKTDDVMPGWKWSCREVAEKRVSELTALWAGKESPDA